jgi:peptide/nickel transport system permease protein
MRVLRIGATSAARTAARAGGLRATGPVGMICAAVIMVAALAAIFGPLMAPHDPNASNLSLEYAGPSGSHLLGLDVQGRDMLSRLLVGARTAILGPLVVVCLSLTVGIILAVIAAWRRGVTDSVISSSLDIVFAFPGILLAILAAAIFGAGLVAATVAISIAYTPYVARVLRGAALKERSQAYVAALEVGGHSATSVCMRHLLPNMAPLIIAQGTIMFGWAMVDLAAVSYLGLGVQPPTANWGVMIAENQSGILLGYPLPAIVASVCIVLVVIAFNVLGERLFDAARRQ